MTGGPAIRRGPLDGPSGAGDTLPMPRALLHASAVALIALPFAAAASAGDGEGDGDEIDFPTLAAKVLENFPAFDADADGKVSAEEFPVEDLFVVLDANKDGFVTKEELAKAVKQPDPAGGKGEKEPGARKGPMGPVKPATPDGDDFIAWAKERVAVDPRFNAENRRTQFLAGFDRDPKDGKVQRKEYQSGDADRVFRDFDADKDGALDEKELLGLMRDQVHDLAKSRRHPDRYNFLTLFDLDNDGNVTRREYAFLRGPSSRFKSFDEDGDGVVTYAELNYMNANVRDKRLRGRGVDGAEGGVPAETKTLWELYDKDKDGRVTPEEFGGGEAVFRRLDRNRDGYLTLADG